MARTCRERGHVSRGSARRGIVVALRLKGSRVREKIHVPSAGGIERRRAGGKRKRPKHFGSTVGKGYYHHAGGPKSMSSGGRRHNGSHNGHHSAAASLAIEHNGHHPPREPRKEENTLVRRSFRRCGDEWRADSRRCVSRDRCKIACCNPFLT